MRVAKAREQWWEDVSIEITKVEFDSKNYIFVSKLHVILKPYLIVYNSAWLLVVIPKWTENPPRMPPTPEGIGFPDIILY